MWELEHEMQHGSEMGPAARRKPSSPPDNRPFKNTSHHPRLMSLPEQIRQKTTDRGRAAAAPPTAGTAAVFILEE